VGGRHREYDKQPAQPGGTVHDQTLTPRRFRWAANGYKVGVRNSSDKVVPYGKRDEGQQGKGEPRA
jgi:hypothetical protein